MSGIGEMSVSSIHLPNRISSKKTPKQLEDENFRRQSVTFEEKADRLREEFGADVFLLVRRKGKLTGYTSSMALDDPRWPP